MTFPRRVSKTLVWVGDVQLGNFSNCKLTLNPDSSIDFCVVFTFCKIKGQPNESVWTVNASFSKCKDLKIFFYFKLNPAASVCPADVSV